MAPAYLPACLQVEEEVRTELAEVHGAMDVIVGVLDEACKDGEEGNKAMEAQEAAAGLISMFAEDDDEMADFIGQARRCLAPSPPPKQPPHFAPPACPDFAGHLHECRR